MATSKRCVQVGVAILMLLGMSILSSPVTADVEEKWDVLPYDLALPLHKGFLDETGVDLEAGEPGCDEQGLVSVRFCETLNDGTGWNHAWIHVWDHGNPSPVPVGAKYTFFSDGHVIQQGAFCEEVHVRVPPAADELFVEVAHVESLDVEGSTLKKCAAVPFDGDVLLRWTKVSDPELGDPPDEGDPPKCICECDCHPVFGCECECRPAEDSDCDCNEAE